MSELIIKYNDLTAKQFIELWESVWDEAPSLEQTELALTHTLFKVSIWENDTIIAMARMIGDMGLDYYIKDVVVRPEYQGRGIGSMLLKELMNYINEHGVKGTEIFVELASVPEKIPFYKKHGFDTNQAQRLMLYHTVK